MPCFAWLRETPHSPVRLLRIPRSIYKCTHRSAGCAFLTIFVLTLLVALHEDGYIFVSKAALYLPSSIILWPAPLLWCLYCATNNSDEEEESLLITTVAFFATMVAISLTLVGFQPSLLNGGGDYGNKFVPLFLLLGSFLMMGCLMCATGNSMSNKFRFGICAGMAFVAGLIAVLIQLTFRLDGGYGDDGPSWLLILLPSFILDGFGLICVIVTISDHCHSQRGLNRQSGTSFALTVVFTVAWLALLVAKILFIVREDSIPLYYSLGNVGPLKLRDTSQAVPALVVAAPLLLLGLYFMTIDCTMPCLSKAADYSVQSKFSKIQRDIEERKQEREDMERTRTLGHRVFDDSFDDSHVVEMVATAGEKSSEKEGGEEGKGASSIVPGKDAVTSIDIAVVDDGPLAIVEWVKLLNCLEICETTETCIETLQQLAALVNETEHLKTKDRKLEIIKCAKEKKARNKRLWTAEVAVEFRKVLENFSILAALGINIHGLRQISRQLMNPFRRSSKEEEEEEEEEKEDDSMHDSMVKDDVEF